MKDLSDKLLVAPNSKTRLRDFDPDEVFGLDKATAQEKLRQNVERLAVLQYLLYAEAKRAVVVVLQGIDAAGKDGTIRNVMTGLNPQGVHVVPFKAPEGEEKRHDYLWRVHKAVPEYGQLGIFNRSHYEDVLIVRVHNLVPKSTWSQRYEQINDFEKMLTRNNVTLVKLLLSISKEEQSKRFRQRLEDPEKNWKFSEADLTESEHWDEYMAAYDDMLAKCSTDHAPWHVIPANRKWFRNMAVSQILLETMEAMDLRAPTRTAGLEKIQFE